MLTLALSKQDLLNIVLRASTIDERLENGLLADDSGITEEIVKARMEAWCQAIAKGDWKQFRQRLAWDGLNEQMVRSVLGAVRVPEEARLPNWVDTLVEALSLAAALHIDAIEAHQEDVDRLSFLDASEPLPFEEILVPFVLLTQQHCKAHVGDAYNLLSEEAHVALQRSLLQTLTSYAARALYLEFSIKCNQAQSPLERLLAADQEHNQRHLYQEFVEQMLQGGMVSFFQEYTVLARLLATVTELWVETTTEFMQRLATDWSDIQQMFAGESKLGKVTSVMPSLSDPHRGRRRVIALTFASGHKLVYKPKDLGTEEAYHRLLAWCNEHGIPLPFKVLKVLDRSSYGWVEFVEHESCKDREEARRYYQRAGMLLCLIYALEGTDCHYENIIASGEHPVLVDVETLMHHRPRVEDEGEGALAQLLAYEQIGHSVLRTGLLPSWQVTNNGRVARDISGLGGIGEQGEFQVPQWMHMNSDRMALEQVVVKVEMQVKGPLLNGVPLRLEEYSEDLIEGFREMYRFLLEQRTTLLAGKSPLHEMANQQVRFVYRATRIYGTLMQKLLDPKYLRDGIERSIQLELFGRAVLPLEGPLRDKGERTRWWSVFAAERQAMMLGDVPFFTSRASSDALLVASGQEIEACFEEPSFDLVVTRLQTLDNEDLERQVAFIQGSLYSHVARDVARTPVINSAAVELSSAAGENVSSERLIAQALAIAEEISRQAIRGADGSAAWIAPQFLFQAERYQLQPMGYDLYGGTCGVGLFLAGIEKVIGGSGYRELAFGAVQPLRQALLHYGQRTVRDLGIGGATGLGSVIYTLTRMSQWLDVPELLEDARRAASLITEERIADDKALDIVAGGAGTILGLLALYDVTADRVVLDKAIACGRHLLQIGNESKAGWRVWPTFGKKLLTGFSHGAAGIVYALLRLYAVTGDGDVLAAAQEGLAYEESLFVPEVGNWPDLRAGEQLAFMTSWCHGAPGIALGRIGGLAMLDSDDIREDIEIAVETTRAVGVQGIDHLCCGGMGRAEVLLVAASQLSRPDLAQLASTWAGQIVARAEDSGTFALHPLLPKGVYSPSFFQGTAGIGYELLRITHPDVLPSVLLWE